jgi:hypothetical protein
VITFRQHVVTIISVFVALAVGVVLGAGPLSDVADKVESGPAAAETDRDEDAVAFSDTFVEESGDSLVAGRLDGRGVAVVVMPGADEDVVSDLGELVARAGGDVAGTYRVSDVLTDPAQKPLVDTLGSQLLSQQAEGAADSASPTYVRIGQLLGSAIAHAAGEGSEAGPTPQGRAVVQAMVGAELLADPGELGQRAPLVLVVLGDEPEPEGGGDAITAGVVEGLLTRSVGAVVVGAVDDGGEGQLGRLRATGSVADVATVDGIDVPAGRVAAVLTLAYAAANDGGSFGASGSDGAAPLG